MGLEKEVCSLKYAKEIKKLDMKLKSSFYWLPKNYDRTEYTILYIPSLASMPEDCYPAPTVAELGEIIKRIKGQVVTYFNNYKKEFFIEWVGDYDHKKDMTPNECFSADTEADARAKVVIYAKKNKLIEAEDA